MVMLNRSGEEVNARIVYYGPAQSGKTTNLIEVHERVPGTAKTSISSMKSRTDRTMSFDFIPERHGEIAGYPVRYTVCAAQGQVYYNATHKLVLGGVDAIVFVADSSKEKKQENIDSLRTLEENLNEMGLSLDRIPWVIQYNKRDFDDAVPIKELEDQLNLVGVPAFEARANSGLGVRETFEEVAGLLHQILAKKLEDSGETDTAGPAGDVGETFENAVENAFREIELPSEAPTSTTGVAKPEASNKTGGSGPMFGDDADATIDSEVGRTLSFDEAEVASDAARAEAPAEFITDPMGSLGTTASKTKSKEKESKAETAKKEKERKAKEAEAKKEEEQKAKEAKAQEEKERKAREAEAAKKEKEGKAKEAEAKKEGERKAKEARAQEEKERKAREAEAAKKEKERKAKEVEAKKEGERKAKEARAQEEKERKAREAEAKRKLEEAEQAARAREDERNRKKSEQERLEAEAREASDPLKALDELDVSGDSEVSIPVTVTRSQIRRSKGAPLRLVLEVTIVDD